MGGRKDAGERKPGKKETDPMRALRKTGPAACTVPANHLEYLGYHKNCEDRHLALAARYRPQEIEASPEPALIELRKMIYATMAETHRMRAFVRLAPLGEEVLHGFLEPEHKTGAKITAILARRFPMTIILLGNRRESWVCFFKGKGVLHAHCGGLNTTVERLKGLLGGEEMGKDVEKLWNIFYHSQFTPRRRNMKRFHQAMPKKSLKKARLVTENDPDRCTTLDDFF